MSAGRRWIPLVAGVLFVLVGLTWVLQGAGLLTGSVMTDDRRWLVIGVATAALGAALLYRGAARRS